jgi:hypothetical protein
MMQKIGVDKIELTTKEYSIKNLKNNQFGIDTTIKQGVGAPSQTWVDECGNLVNAWKIYHNAIGNYSINDFGLKISFNPSKIFHPYKLISTSDKQYHESFKKIHDECKKIGLHFDLESCAPVRIDIAKNVEMNHDLIMYENAFKLLKGRRMKNQRFYEGGYLIKSTQNQISFYDKRNELLANNINIEMHENNLLRGEMRLTSTKSVGKKLNISTIKNFNDFTENEVADIYKTFLNKMIFPKQFESTQSIIDFNKESEILKECHRIYGRNFIDTYLALKSIDMLILEFGNLNNFKNFLSDTIRFNSRNTINNIMKKIESKLLFKAIIDNQKNQLTPVALVDELQLKFGN